MMKTQKASPSRRCASCGNLYDKAFEVVMAGERHVFDCFECAIHKLAPTCAHCDCRVIGHGVEAAGTVYCCAHCAEAVGVHGLEDRLHGKAATAAAKGTGPRDRQNARARSEPRASRA